MTSLDETHRSELDELCSTGREIHDRGLTVGSGGNLSARVPLPGAPDDGSAYRVLITRRGAKLRALSRADIVAVDCVDDRVTVVGDDLPSSELPLHLRVYAETDARAVVHTHSTYAIVMSARGEVLPALHYAQAMLGGQVRVAPYATFGTDALADSTATALAGRRAVLMRNHGALTIGDSLSKALEHATMLEWLAKLAALSQAGGGGTEIDPEELGRVAHRSTNWGSAEVAE